MSASSASKVRRDTEFGFLDRLVDSEQHHHPLLISNSAGNTMVKAITAELRRARTFTFSVAFVSPNALSLLKQSLLDFDGRGRLITSTYLNFNSPAAFRELLNMPNTDVYVVDPTNGGFHAKGYLFTHDDGCTAIIGSSNLTATALIKNEEWNLRFSALPNGDIVEQIERAVDAQLKNAVPLTQEWIDEYQRTYVPPPTADPDASVRLDGQVVTPNAMQSEALTEIQRVRDAGENRAVVVSATGTGKTILAALDVQAFAPERMLFVVHREQILDRAIEEFRRVLGAPETDFGKYVGTRRELDRRYVFATIQSIGRRSDLEQIGADHFDYVLIDEVHRAGALSYRQLINHLEPRFTLGVTATPERTDEFNVYELFDFNVPYEIRLQRALEEEMLTPFHYFGVTDFEIDGEVIDETTQLSRLVRQERAEHVVRALRTYGHAGAKVRGLIFCSRTEEAFELSRMLNTMQVQGNTLRTLPLTGHDSTDEREKAIHQLEAGELDYILTVDVFNEGIDIPAVNQVVMLRQTQSSIVFTQQLGRGLRKSPGKEHLVVIDFIGNYTNNYLIPIALFGNTSLNKDSVRRSIIDAREAGAISGLSSVNFDRVAQERIFASLASTKLDSMKLLKSTFAELANRLGHAPTLLDFARFDTADPVIVAAARETYWNFLLTIKEETTAPSPLEQGALKYVSRELLNGKRPHELVVLKHLVESPEATLDDDAIEQLFRQHDCPVDGPEILSVKRILSQEFFTASQRNQYGPPLVGTESGQLSLSSGARQLLSGRLFTRHLNDAIDTGLHLSRHRYQWNVGLEIGKTYSRKDACRLLNWTSNQEGVLNGYKIDSSTGTCPIFVTYEKHEDVSDNTAYGDEFINERTMRWFTRPNRTLRSSELGPILSNSVSMHLFVKKKDGEGSDHYYLGRVTSSNAEQTTMPRTTNNVVTMSLTLESKVESTLYDYFVSSTVVEYEGARSR